MSIVNKIECVGELVGRVSVWCNKNSFGMQTQMQYGIQNKVTEYF